MRCATVPDVADPVSAYRPQEDADTRRRHALVYAASFLRGRQLDKLTRIAERMAELPSPPRSQACSACEHVGHNCRTCTGQIQIPGTERTTHGR